MALGALGFVAVMFLPPKLRRRFIEGVVAHHVRSEELGGRLYRYRKVAVAVIAATALIFPIAASLIPSQYMSYLTFTIVILNLVAGSVLIAGLPSKTARRAVLLVFLLFLIGVAVGLLSHILNI